MKEKKIKKEYIRRTRNLLETKLNSRNFTKRINTWVAPLVSLIGIFLKKDWKRTSTNVPKTRKLAMMSYTRYIILTDYVPRKKRRKRTHQYWRMCNASILGFENYLKKRKKRFITAMWNSTNNIKINRKTVTRKQKWEENQLYGYFERQTDEISQKKTWTGLRGTLRKKLNLF